MNTSVGNTSCSLVTCLWCWRWRYIFPAGIGRPVPVPLQPLRVVRSCHHNQQCSCLIPASNTCQQKKTVVLNQQDLLVGRRLLMKRFIIHVVTILFNYQNSYNYGHLWINRPYWSTDHSRILLIFIYIITTIHRSNAFFSVKAMQFNFINFHHTTILALPWSLNPLGQGVMKFKPLINFSSNMCGSKEDF